MSDSSQRLVLDNADPMTAARLLLSERFSGEDGQPHLFIKDDVPYEWYGDNRWIQRSYTWLEDELWTLLDCCVTLKFANGQPMDVAYVPNKHRVANVSRALQALTRFPYATEPAWMDGKDGHVDTGRLLAFQDIVIGIKETAERWDGEGPITEWVGEERGCNLFSPVVAPVCFDEEAECPIWDRCMQQWSGNDPVWIECRERMYAYCWMAHRSYAKWFLEYGKVRGGKGTGTGFILKKLLGSTGYVGKSFENLVGQFGLDRAERARVLVVSEATEMTRKEASYLSSLIKGIVGQDEMDVNVKHVRQAAHVLPCVPIVQANEMLSLPNTGRGVTSKMVGLPFDASFEGKEDFGLQDKLLAELPGIALRIAKAAVRLEKAATNEKFPMPERSKELVKKFEMQNNPLQAFLDARFVRDPNGKVSNEVLRKQRKDWEQMTELVITRSNGTKVSELHLPSELISGTSWSLASTKWYQKGGGEVRGVAGLRLRSEARDD